MKAIAQAEGGRSCHAAPFFVAGKLVEGGAVVHRSRDLGVDFATPVLDLDALVLPRTQPAPLLDVPLKEIIDFLVATGQRIADRGNPHIQACVERMCLTMCCRTG